MKIKIKLVGFPKVEQVVGGKELDLQLEGNTFGDLLRQLKRTYGELVTKNLQGQILRNGREWIHRDNLTCSLQDGDQVTFLQMMGGG
jgi:molybdopterin converting factor small subunit